MQVYELVCNISAFIGDFIIMITSMTGFGLAEKNNKDFSIEINIRSENNRFFDFNIKSPSSLLPLEKNIRELCKKKCYFFK